MITKFDKGAKAEYFKEQFAECIDDCAYEDAFDFLLKYADEKHNADFHMPCVMPAVFARKFSAGGDCV